MRDFLIIFKVLLKNQYSYRIANNGKRKLPQGITTLLCMIPFAILICIIAGVVAVIIPDRQTLSNVSNIIVSAVQLLALFVTMFGVMNILYNSPDTPFLNTLPVRHTAVFFAKFTIAYISMLSLMASLLLPSLLTVSIVYAAMGRAMFYGYFALVFLLVLAAPILPLFIVTAFSMPISYIGTFFKGKSVLKTILTLLFYLLIMVGYFLLIYFINQAESSDATGDEIAGNVLAGLSVFSKVMYPNKVLIDFCLGIDAGKSFGISLAITVGMLALMLIFAMLFYRRINVRKLETHSGSSKSAVSYKQSNIISSLMAKDFKHIIRNSSLAMSSLANILICPIITAVMYFASDMQTGGEDVPMYLNSTLKLSYIVLYTLIFLGGANAMAMLAYTREGRSFYLSKSLPISPRDSIKAKYILALIPSAVVLVIQVILALALYKLDILSVILFFVSMAMAIVGSTGLHIYFDMRYGNVNWNTRQDLRQVSQGNRGSLLISLVTVAMGLAAMIGGMVMSAFSEIIGGINVVLGVFWGVLMVCSLALLISGILVIRYKAESYYDEIGERKFKPREYGRSRSGGRGGSMLMR